MSPLRTRLAVLLLGCLGALALSSVVGAADPAATPAVRVEQVRRAFHNGEHNAFTDLCRFRGRYYLAFRSCPDGHGVHPSASIIVLTSDDNREWREAHRFRVPRRDTRDPHFLVFQERLHVLTGTWYCGDTSPKDYELNQHLGYSVSTADGEQWQGPVMLEGTYGHYIWRGASWNGKAYLCGRRKHEFAEDAPREDRAALIESALLESEDGVVWRKAALFQEEFGDETAFAIADDGALLAVSRCGGGRHAQLCRSRAPFREWTRVDLDRYIGGPLLARWGSRRVVGGRRMLPEGPITSLCWLEDEQLHEFARLPSGGDNSYPGLVELAPDHAVVSWYSSHERDESGRAITAIYLADLRLGE